MIALSLLLFAYFFVVSRRRLSVENEPSNHTPPPFVFGTSDVLQLIENYNKLDGVFAINWKIKLRDDGFFEVYENNVFKRIIRKPFRRAKRCIRIVEDNQESRKCLACRICTVNKMCVMYEPCGHLGVCNECSYMITNLAFYKKSNCKMFPYRMIPDPRYTHRDNTDDILYDIQLSKNECPFCKTYVHNIKYVYIP